MEYEDLIDEVIQQIKTDVETGDVTVLEELLRMIPVNNLIESLPEGLWHNFKELRE